MRRECPCRDCLIKRAVKDQEEEEFVNFGFPAWTTRMILCEKCGNKRCPHATNHIHECTGSNESGQQGSIYE